MIWKSRRYLLYRLSSLRPICMRTQFRPKMSAKSVSSAGYEESEQPPRKQHCPDASPLQDEWTRRRQLEPKSLETTPLHTIWFDGNYIAVAKPADVRHDGDHDVTLEKIIRYNHSVEKVYNTHRLDYATSGVICLAGTKAAAAYLSGLFEDRLANKAYTALVEGHISERTLNAGNSGSVAVKWFPEDKFIQTDSPINFPYTFLTATSEYHSETPVSIEKSDYTTLSVISQAELTEISYCCFARTAGKAIAEFLIEAPIADPEDTSQFCMKLGTETNPGREAETYVRVLEHTYKNNVACSRVQLIPKTGRRHQLRLHMASVGHRILGDIAYGGSDTFERMYLHAHQLLLPFGLTKLMPNKRQRPLKKYARQNLKSASETDEIKLSERFLSSWIEKLKREKAHERSSLLKKVTNGEKQSFTASELRQLEVNNVETLEEAADILNLPSKPVLLVAPCDF